MLLTPWGKDKCTSRKKRKQYVCRCEEVSCTRRHKSRRPRGRPKLNKLGYFSTKAKGMYYDVTRDRWLATIMVSYKKIYLGRFKTKLEAMEARSAFKFIPYTHASDQVGSRKD